jgi:CheY-like chemotaxis protein
MSPGTATEPAPKRLRVLIVDDNRDVADSLAALISLWGYPVSVAYDGEAGFRAAVEGSPDCLLLDINMPGLDGYALARRLRRQANLRRAKLVAFSARSDPDHARRAEEAGFDYRLTKPATPEDLEGLLTMMENLIRIAEQTEGLARRNVALAERTEQLSQQNVALAGETRELIQEVKEELKEVKQDVREIKQDLKEVKERVEKEGEGGPAGG